MDNKKNNEEEALKNKKRAIRKKKRDDQKKKELERSEFLRKTFEKKDKEKKEKEKKNIEKKENIDKKVLEKNDNNKPDKIIEKEVIVRTVKTGFNLIEVIIIMLITALMGVLVGCFVSYINFEDSREVSCAEVRKDIDEFAEVYDDLLNEYYGKVDREGLLKAGIVGMVNYLDDPYSTYFDSVESITLNEDLSGEFIGVGIDVLMQEKNTSIISVHTDSPAHVAGMKPGDVIIKFNDIDITNLPVEEIANTIVTDKKGDKVKFTVLRDGKELTFDLVTDLVEVQSVFGFTRIVGEKKIGYIAIKSFSNKTYDQFLEVYEQLDDGDLDGLVLDVRDNNGGYLSVAKDIAELFLDKGTVIYQKDTKGKIEKVLAETDKKIDLDVVLLTNKVTASAAEILVAALKENLGSDVVGVETYGKGTIQKLYELSDGSFIRFTAQKWLTPKGHYINYIGIAPTHFVDMNDNYNSNPSYDNDNQFNYALDLFK